MLAPFFVAFFALFEIVGNSASDISVNFWIYSFPSDAAANFTILLLSQFFYVAFIVPATLLVLWRQFRKLKQSAAAAVTSSESPLSDALMLPSALATTPPEVSQPEKLESRSNDDCEAPNENKMFVELQVRGSRVEADDSTTIDDYMEGGTTSGTIKWRAFFSQRQNYVLLLLVTLADLSVDVFGTYAAGHIPILVQVILKSLEPLVCWFLSCLVWRGAYCEKSLLLVLPSVAVVVAVGGVLAEAWFALQANHDEEKAYVGFWICIYSLRVFASAAYNVSQGHFIRRNLKLFGSNRLLLSLLILSADAVLSLILLLLVGPAVESIRYAQWGSASSIGASWENFSKGAACVVHDTERCPGAGYDNLLYGLITNGAWVAVYVADSYLNEASPALNSLLNMLSSPITTVVLIIVPQLSLGTTVHRDADSIVLQAGGVVLMLVAVILFYEYEKRKERKGANVMDTAKSVEIKTKAANLED